MMIIDLDIAFRSDRQIEEAMFREEFEHVVHERNAGVDRASAFAVEVEGDEDIGFPGLAGDFAFSHDESLNVHFDCKCL